MHDDKPPVWPEDLAHHLTRARNPFDDADALRAPYDAGYAAAFHPYFGFADADRLALESWRRAGGADSGTYQGRPHPSNPGFLQGFGDARAGASNQFDDLYGPWSPDDHPDPFDPRLIGAALEAARYAEAVMRRTAGEDMVLPPDAPHQDWQPRYKNDFKPTVRQWHPSFGETHVKYHIYQMGGGRNPVVWGANHHGTYEGMETVDSPSGAGGSITWPKYTNGYEPDQLGRFRTPEQAQAAAEEHYEQTYKSRPSALGETDIDSIMDQLGAPPPSRRGLGDDEDYGHIFDAARRALRKATAALRRVAFTNDQDWQTDQWGNHECRLENGHVLYCTQIKSRPEMGWQWGIYDRNHPDPEVRANAVRAGGQHWGDSTLDGPRDHLPTAEHAKRQAEEHYKAMYPLGTDTGGHKSPIGDSGLDYESLINPRDDLGDDDYSHIFGMLRQAGWNMADVIRLAGDGMSWEDTMAHIDKVLAEGERPNDGSVGEWRQTVCGHPNCNQDVEGDVDGSDVHPFIDRGGNAHGSDGHKHFPEEWTEEYMEGQ